MNEQFEYANKLSMPSFNVGYNYAAKPFLVTVMTNRLLNQSSEKIVRKDGLSFGNKTRIIADTLMIGYPINRLIPNVFVSNVEVNKKLYRDKLVGRTNKHSIIYGFGFNYLFNKNISYNASFIAPNNEQGLEYGLSFGINYNF